MKDTERVIQDLQWNNSEVTQKNAIKELMNISEEEAILLAKQSNEVCSKACWHNAALILKDIGYPRNGLTISYLMEWFQDINWPGVGTIIDLLKNIDLDIIEPYIINASKKAINNQDEEWCWGLQFLIEELNAKDSSNEMSDLYLNLEKVKD